MSPRHIPCLLTSGLCLLTSALRAEFPTPTNNQVETIPLTPPEKTIGMMHLPPGFKATLFAAEPDVQQPIAMCWDEKGRLWVAENYTYSDGAERFDMKLKDRILIFEDTKNTGHFDKRTVFYDNLQMLTSIERGFGGVYALCPPNLLWIPTKDDKPTGPPQILLDGFSTTAASRHTFANGLKWGPDGWLYGRIGISSTSWVGVPGTPQEKRQPTAGGIWRYHPTRKIYEPWCHGTTNPWGMDWDEHGEMFFINTVIGHFWHGIQGAHFKRMHGEDPYPHIYDLIDQHADHYHWDTGEKWSDTKKAGPSASTSEKGGGHAHVGFMIYQGTNFPKEYRGKAFMTNLHGHRVNMDIIERQGSGYVAKHGADFMLSDDPWFRAVEIQYGPDGGVYILDWSDIGECHEADGVHRTSGRIYKITYGDPVKPKETDMTKLSDKELIKLQLSDNEWLVRMARWELRERASRGKPKELGLDFVAALGAASFDELESKLSVKVRLRLNWLSENCEDAWSLTEPTPNFYLNGGFGGQLDFGGKEEPMRVQLIDHMTSTLPSYLSARTAWIAGNSRGSVAMATPKPGDKLVEDKWKIDLQTTDHAVAKDFQMQIASGTTSRIRLALASALPQLPETVWTQQIRSNLLSHPEDATDHNLPLMYWYGICNLPPAELVKLVKGCRIPLIRQFIARRVTEEIDKDPAPLNELLTLSATGGSALDAPTTNVHFLPIGASASPVGAPTLVENILQGMTDALKGWRKAKKPEAWDKFAATLRESSTRVPSRDSPTNSDASGVASNLAMLRDLNVLFGDGRALDEVRAIALDDKADVEARRSALRTLVEAKSPDTRKICEKLLSERSLSLDATQGLATFDDPAIAEAIVKRWRNFYPSEHGAVVAALASRPSFAKVLLKQLGQGVIEHNDISPAVARQIRSFNDPALTKLLADTWGEVHESRDDIKKLITTLKAKLTPEFIAKGNPSQGRFLFTGICAACHKLYGEGANIGPDLTGSGRHEVNYLIENIADPSAVVAADFTMVIVTLKDGRVLNGIIGARTERTITLKMVGQDVTVDRNDITKQQQLPISMMPEGQLTAMNDQQVADLISYLMSNAQVPLPQAAAAVK